jgi:mannose-1-phosphate guanylyltransferase
MTTHYALILAGGIGTRLWPRSRVSRPKQLLSLVTERSMLQETVARIEGLVPPERIVIMTNAGYADAVRAQVPQVPAENIIAEPAVRGTASAIGYAAMWIAQRDAEAIMFSLHADHHIRDVDAFRRALRAAAQVAADDWLVTLGVKPDFPETGYGYIERGQPLGEFDGHVAYQVVRFTEKPDVETATRFVESGRYYWNSGLFTWRVSTILNALARYMPDTHARLTEIAAAIGTPQEQAVMERVWPTLENQTIDYGIMERADRVAVLPVDFGWNDVGSWDALFQILKSDDDDNVIQGDHVGLDTQRSLIYSRGRLIVTVGVTDLVIVDTDDVVLVCPRSRAQDVKRIVELLEREGRKEVL